MKKPWPVVHGYGKGVQSGRGLGQGLGQVRGEGGQAAQPREVIPQYGDCPDKPSRRHVVLLLSRELPSLGITS